MELFLPSLLGKFPSSAKGREVLVVSRFAFPINPPNTTKKPKEPDWEPQRHLLPRKGPRFSTQAPHAEHLGIGFE